jgi:two-component system LytT family response regulator
MPAIRTIVVDDEAPARVRLLELLRRDADVEVVGVAGDGLAAVELIREQAPDILFLDVQMPGLDGFGVLQALAPGQLPVTVFVTAYDQYAIQAFDAHAIDYLLKPYSDQRFESALKRARTYLGSVAAKDVGMEAVAAAQERQSVDPRSGYLERLVLKSNGCVTFLDVNDIDWIEAAGVYVYLHVGTRTHLYRSSVAQLVQRLDPARFVRIHRSSAVNTSRIRELHARSHGDFTVVLRTGVELTMSRGYRTELEAWLKQPL